MDLQRNEYPALLDSLSPAQAVAALGDRVKHVGKLNLEIANWLQERRRLEEQYADGMKRLARRQPPDESSELGIFSSPWQTLIGSVNTIAESHLNLARKIEIDVEQPLRLFTEQSREMQAMSTIQGNLTSMSKEIETAQKRVEKAAERNDRGSSEKLSKATQELDNAQSQWKSQAPYVFETLQAVDENRCNHLRDVLTQYQTHEVDLVERNRVTAEQCLNALLNIETADEIKTFAVKTTQNAPRLTRDRRLSLAPSTSNAPATFSPPPVPPPPPASRSTQRSTSFQPEDTPQKKSRLKGLKRFGTVLKRNKSGLEPLPQSDRASPERRTRPPMISSASSFLRSNRSRSRDVSVPLEDEEPRPPPSRQDVERVATNGSNGVPSRIDQAPPPMNNLPIPGREKATEPVPAPAPAALQEPLQPGPSTNGSLIPSETFQEKPRDEVDPITQAERDAAAAQLESDTSDAAQPALKLDIRDAPIAEEGADNETAMANVTNLLRSQATPQRRSGTLRGRRDVRNTVFIPNPPNPLENISKEPVPAPAATTASPSQTFASPISPAVAIPASPLKPGSRSGTFSEDPTAASDAQSIRSDVSSAPVIRHPDLNEPGLNWSSVEVVSAWFEKGTVAKAAVVGEIALAYNPKSGASSNPTASQIRLENFAVLEKVAPNPAFVEQLPNRSGEYSLNLAHLGKASIAFKYQVHLEDNTLTNHTPLMINPAWRIEATQSSVILSYSLHPAFESVLKNSPHEGVTFTNLILSIALDPTAAKATSCQSKPVGTFARERSLIYWKLGDVTLQPGAAPQKLLARFLTEGEGRAGHANARWEIVGSHVSGLGSGLAVSVAPDAGETPAGASSDPFADEGGRTPLTSWKEVEGARKLISGTYVADV